MENRTDVSQIATRMSSADPTVSTQLVSAKKERKLWPHFLIQTEGEGAPRNFILDKERMLSGWDEKADIPTNDKNSSRIHAEFLRAGEEYIIKDCDSQNGVYLNGLKIHSAVLRDGDSIQIASNLYIYHEG